MDQMMFGDVTLTWLDGGATQLDGGTMFGVVPKALWQRKYEANEKNQVLLRTDPILIQIDNKNVMIESGIGLNKMDEKQKRNYGVENETKVEESLKKLGLTTDDIDYVLMTHMHFDHACGLSKWEGENLVSAFKNATILTTEVEWNEMRNPNIRSRNTYWENNWKPIQDQVKTFKEEIEVLPGLKMIHTGGHSDGHAIITFERGEQKFIHMADIMPTHAHQNVLWVLAFDDYPMDSIKAKQKWMDKGLSEEIWYIFYHDAYYRAIKWDSNGKEIDTVKLHQK